MRSQRRLALAALIVVLAPIAAAVVLFFGGTAVGTCLGGPGSACWPRALVGPFIRTSEGIAVSLAICGVAWLAANSVIVAHLVQVNRRRLARLIVAIAVFAITMAAVGFVRGLEYRLLTAAEGALTWGFTGLVIAWVVGVIWAGLGATRVANPRSTGRP